VGIGAILLLRREEARLSDRASYADEARRAAVTARARLIAENIELLVGDVQSGLLDVLAAEPPDQLGTLLDQLEQTNPLVRTAFQCAPDGRVLRPLASQTTDDGRGFLRRFGQQLRAAPPWRSDDPSQLSPFLQAAPAAKPARDELAQSKQVQMDAEEALSRQQVAYNTAKIQSARREAQALASNKLAEADLRYDSTSASGQAAPAASGADLGAVAEKSRAQNSKEFDNWKKEAPVTPEQRGWLPVKVDGRLHLLGWVRPAAADDVRGIELEMAGLISRLGGTLPAEVTGEEGYALQDELGRVLHQTGKIGRIRTVTIPLSAELLPGWKVVAYIPLIGGDTMGSAVFLFGSLLVGLFVAAIVAGGSLLLWQARRSEAEAAQKTSFVANVSHEFKTPLTTIRLYAELLEQGRVRDAGQSGEYLRTIGRETQRLARLVGNALDFSRLEQGRKKYARDTFDLRAELARLLDTQAPRLAEAGLTLKRELPAAALMITSDRDALEQILLNLLDNAAKYGAAGGEVTVGLAARQTSSPSSGQAHSAGSGQAGGAEIRVLDRGPGVPAEHRERVFEKFHRVDDTLTAEKSGAGLGLSIARQLARGLGGDLRYVPRQGGGAGFILELP